MRVLIRAVARLRRRTVVDVLAARHHVRRRRYGGERGVVAVVDERRLMAAVAAAIGSVARVTPEVQRERHRGGADTMSPELVTAAPAAVSYTHLRAHETPEHLVCRL